MKPVLLRLVAIAFMAISPISTGLAQVAVAAPPADAVAPAAPTSAADPAVASTVAIVQAIPLASPHASNIRVPSAPDAWGGPRTKADATLSNRVVSYTIDATLDPVAHSLDGHQRMTWRNRSKVPVGAVYLHLYLNAFAGEDSTFATELRRSGGGFRSGVEIEDGEWGHIELQKVLQGDAPLEWTFVHPDNGPETDRTVVRIDLAEPVAPGATLALDVDFEAQLPRVMARTGWYGDFHLVAQWFPKFAVLELPGERGATEPRWNAHEFHKHSEFYADYGSFDVSLTVPENYVVGATGKLQGEPLVADGEATWHFIQHDVIDFAWMAAPDFQVMETTWTGPGSPEVLVRVLYPPEYAASAKLVQQATLDSLTWFSETLGPYPYETVTAVVPPYNADEAGGMEYPTFFTASGFAEVEPGTISQYALDYVTIHEFGHGYFMGLLGSNEFEEPWLDEGLNTYWDNRMLRARGQTLDLGFPLFEWLGFEPSSRPFVAARAGGVGLIHQPMDSLDDNSWNRVSSQSYGSVYARTASTMHDLEERVGKEAMERAFKLYYQRWKFRHPSAADLRQALIDGTGKPDIVNRVFEQQVYGTAMVDDRVTSIESVEVLPTRGTSLIDGEWSERVDEKVDQLIDDKREAWQNEHPDAEQGTGPFPFRTTVTVKRMGAAVPQTLKVTFADDSVETVSWDDDRRWHRFSWVKPVEAVSAEIDPEREIYLDVNKLDDSRTLESDSSASRRLAAAAAAVMQAFTAALGTL